MKKLLFTLALLPAVGFSYAQVVATSFENWTGSTPNGWRGSKTNIAVDSCLQVTGASVYGNSAVQLINQTSSHKRFTTQPVAVSDGQSYEVKFWVKGKGDIRVGIFDSSAVSTTSGYHYSSYVSVNTGSWTMQTLNIIADTTYGTAQFIFSVKSTVAANGHLQIDSAVINAVSPSTTSIYDIQYTVAANGDSPLANTNVTTGGIVSAVYASGYFIQDAPGAWNGIHVFDPTNAATMNIGDSVTMSANVVEYFSMTQLSSVSGFSRVSTGNPVYTSASISTADVNLEDYEGVLVTVSNATCLDDNSGFGMWKVDDGSDSCKIHDLIYDYPNPIIGNVYQITGPVNFAFSEARVCPRAASDVVVSGFNAVAEMETIDLTVFPNPASDVITLDGTFSNSTIEITDLTGKVVYSGNVSGHKPNINVSSLEQGIYILKVQQEGKTGTLFLSVF